MSTSAQPDRPIVFFTDRDLGKLFPTILRASGLSVEKHDDYFANDTPDHDWLQDVGRRGWYVLTHNKRIRYTPNELDAVMLAGVGLFVLVGKATHRELAASFVASIRSVQAFVQRHDRPFIARVYRPTPVKRSSGRKAAGSVTLWLDRDLLRARHSGR